MPIDVGTHEATNETSARAPLERSPFLDRRRGMAELVVDGDRFLVRGAEVHNSSASTAAAARNSFARVAGLGANTVLAPVAWEDLEPSEGQYDLSIVDILLSAAREVGLRLVILWFGAYKNGSSSYAPAWVKTNPARFPRCVDAGGRSTGTLSPFSQTTQDADARAFGELVKRVEGIDSVDRTVVMIQIENEVGLLGHSRDHGTEAGALFAAPTPSEVLDAIARPREDKTWAEAFDSAIEADEHFMTWGFATYVGAVARAGRAHSALPFFTNAWLNSQIDLPGFALAGGQKAGDYPSGGPVAPMLPLWRSLAPALDLVAPDIYFGDFSTICADYGRASQGLFIPEMRRDAIGCGDIFVAIGEHRAIGVAPFGVDSFRGDEAAPLADAYALLAAMESELRTGRPRHGFHLPPDAKPDDTAVLDFGDLHVRVQRLVPFGETGPVDQGAFGIIVRTSDDEFVAVGRGFSATFEDPSAHRSIGILRAEEYSTAPLVLGGREVLRHLNGDETAGGTVWLHPARAQRQSEVFPIPMALDHSGFSSVKIYAIA